MSSPSKSRYWHAAFRAASYANVFGALVWTVVVVLPFHPFSEILPIMVGGGPGLWLVVSYPLCISLGGGAFGWLSGLLYVIEKQENRDVGPAQTVSS
ncbi:MAG: hypothetical protein ACLP9K_08470 [Nitrososphaerales archaeon]|jgi:hypothetical protein